MSEPIIPRSNLSIADSDPSSVKANAEEKKVNLPALAPILYEAQDAYDVLKRLNKKVCELSGDIFYADQLSIKLQEAMSFFNATHSSDHFLNKMQNQWLSDIHSILVKSGIFYKSSLRRKSVMSLLSKMNRVMGSHKSIDSIHDLLGVEFTIFTPTNEDSAETLDVAYTAANRIIEYFSNSRIHLNSEKFTLCDPSPLKDTYSKEEMNSIDRATLIGYFRSINPSCYIPAESGLLPEYQFFVKDYYMCPKKSSCYQGLQFVIKTQNGLYFEIQIKTQPTYDYKNDPHSKAYHPAYKEKQHATTNMVANSCPYFDLSFNPSLVKKICGFRENPKYDESGIISPIIWDLRKNTHYIIG